MYLFCGNLSKNFIQLDFLTLKMFSKTHSFKVNFNLYCLSIFYFYAYFPISSDSFEEKKILTTTNIYFLGFYETITFYIFF